jgi:hypothetical protein
MGEVISIRPAANRDAIELLEHWLAVAKSNEPLVHLCVVAQFSDQTSICDIADDQKGLRYGKRLPHRKY